MSEQEIISGRIRKFDELWKRKNSEPLIGYSRGDYFVSKRYRAAAPLLKEGMEISPDMVKAGDFKGDYLRLNHERLENGGDILFGATAYPGIPWIEAMAGCKITAGKSSYHAEVQPDADFSRPIILKNPEWRTCYLSFAKIIADDGRFPLGQPILRGPCDLISAVYGGKELIFNLFDEPEYAALRLREGAELFLQLIRRQQEFTLPFMGGYSMGFYEIWCPDRAMWFQDDAIALLSPPIYEQLVYPVHKMLAEQYPYTMIHLHPNSLYILDYLMEIGTLNAIEINIDVGGPSVQEMLPVLKQVLKKKNLHLWGDLCREELELIKRSLDPEGLSITVWQEEPSQRLP